MLQAQLMWLQADRGFKRKKGFFLFFLKKVFQEDFQTSSSEMW